MALWRERELGWIPRHGRSIPTRKGNSGKHGDSRGFERIGGSQAVASDDLHRWATWLRRNAARQVRGALRRVRPDGTVLVCAIGALDEVAFTGAVLFSKTKESRFMTKVVLLNDCLGWTFDEIATWLELIADGSLGLDEALQIGDPSRLALPVTA